jgi:hypothetical protein
MVSVSRDGARAKRDAQAVGLLDAGVVEELCRQNGYEFRDGGKLPPGRTARHFAWQVLAGNVTCGAVRHHGGGAFTEAAYCMARQRLPTEALRQLHRRVADAAAAEAGPTKPDAAAGALARKRVFVIDGSSVTLPDSPQVRAHFGCSGSQKPGCGYPTAHVLLLTGPGGVAAEGLCSPLRTGDMTHAAEAEANVTLRGGDLLLGDRQFSGVCHLHHLQAQGLDGLFPAHHSRRIAWGRGGEHGKNRRLVKTLGYYDQRVEYRKPDHRPKWMDQAAYEAMPQWTTVREVRRQVRCGGARRWVTLVTTLTDPKAYPAKALVKLLGDRWSIELSLRSLKTTMGLERLRCQSVEGVRKEVLMYLIVYNLVRLLLLTAAKRQGVPVERLSFADALASLRYGEFGGGDRPTDGPVTIKVNPLRPGRVEPRVVKKRPKPFPTMSKPRKQLRQQILNRRRSEAKLA